MVSDAILRAQLGKTLDRIDLPELGAHYHGKVRESYTRGGQRILVVSDRLSAFDVVLGTIPFKGQVLNQLAAHWFEETRSRRAEPPDRRPRPERDARRRVPAAAGRDGGARLPHRRHLDLDLEALRGGLAALRGPRAPGRDAEEPAAARSPS